jgi:polyhydroxyalkanoate synthesis regulator phasin
VVKDALRGYLSLASGLSDVTAARARAAARSLVEQGEATAGQVSALAEDLIATSRRNRESVLLLVRHEVEQAVRRLGVGASSDVETLTTRVRELERTVRELRARAARPADAPVAAPKAATAKAAPAKKPAPAKSRTTKKAAPTKTTATKKTANKTATKAGSAKRTTRSGG